MILMAGWSLVSGSGSGSVASAEQEHRDADAPHEGEVFDAVFVRMRVR
jgi:hypothetical protein